VRFVVVKVEYEEVPLRQFQFSSVCIISPVLHTQYHPQVALSQRDKRMKPGNFPNSCILLEIGEHWIEKNFHFSLQRVKETAGEFLN